MTSKEIEELVNNTHFLGEAEFPPKKNHKEVEPEHKSDGLDLKFDATPAKGEDSAENDEHKDTHTKEKDDATNSETDKELSPRAKLRKMMEPQVEIAKSIVTSITTAYNNLDTKKYKDIEEQIKNFEKQIRGACQQVMSNVKITGFDTANKQKCSPMAYKKITQYESRDRSTLDLVAAILVFHNSLK